MRITENSPGVFIHIRVPESLKKEIDQLADSHGISTAAFTRRALEDRVKKELHPEMDLTVEKVKEMIADALSRSQPSCCQSHNGTGDNNMRIG